MTLMSKVVSLLETFSSDIFRICAVTLHMRSYSCGNRTAVSMLFFYRAMHYSAKLGLAIACRLSVCLLRWWIMTTQVKNLGN